MSSRLKIALFALSTSLFTPVAAWAQSAEPQPADETTASSETEIIVSARRRDERLVDAPVAITALSGAELQDKSMTRFADIATQVPTLIAGRAASGSSASIFLRGVGSTALSAGFDQSVSFVVDGMPMSRGREINLSQYDLQQVEVLKGPQALFFGKNTTGGLINVITAGPGNRFEAALRGGYGFEAREKYAEGYVSGPVSDTLGARLAFRASDSEGALTNTAAKTYLDPLGMARHRNAERRGGGRTLSGRLTLDWHPSDTVNFVLKTGYTDQKDGGPTDILERICGGGRTTPATMNGVPPSPNADCKVDGRSDSSTIPTQVAAANYRYAGDGHMYARLKSGFGILTGTINTEVMDVTSITSYYRFRQTDLNNVAGEAYPATFSQLADYEQYGEELRFQTKFDAPINALFGMFYSHGKFVFNTDAYIFPVPISPVTNTYTTFKRDDGFSSDSMSAFLQVTANLGEQFELSGGARYSFEARDSYQVSLPAHLGFAAFFPSGIRLDDRFRDNNLSPEVTLRYKPSRDLTFYAAYKQGFKSGGFNISQTLTPAATVAAGSYGSETAKGGEVGMRAILLDGDLSFNTTAYYYDYNDLQVQNFDPVTIGQVVANAGTLRTKGIEADFTWRVLSLPGFSLRGAAAYNHAQFYDYVGQCYGGQTVAQGCNLLLAAGAYTSQDYGGRTPPKAPRFGGSLGFTYEMPISSSDIRLVLSGDMAHTSSYNYTDTLRPDSIQPAFTKFDASIRLKGPEDRWSVAVIGRNLTNKLIVTAANDIPFAGGTGTGTTGTGLLADMSAFVENPREVFVEVGFKF
ncbi:outer membrane receptor protein involved in Fe transport [Novosphingobium kunmingense]|uniref:Outer membrane receptor protein involved in Fe transport n=1 Tax=Novosphingobium kunmingense TaxID=1211806 RepID=A0A2N0H789_9SPHN|nr:TonB-dependent receptor [Novosphingobium kunmingense]PKB14796.1 outer membrane receptor protein involved in Fe transport [Novosphingobium kunmingense]